jgi:diguanylate cyclase (GGDEF)-like protein
MTWPKLSIRSTVLLAIVVGVLLPAMLVLVVDSHLARRAQEPILERNQAAVLALATAVVMEPAWTLSQPALQDALQRILRERSVCGVELLDLQPALEPMVLSDGTCSGDQALLWRESSVLHDGQVIARLRLAFDGGEVDRLVAERRGVTVWMVLAQVIFGVAVLAGVLSLRVLRPIGALKRQAGGLAARKPQTDHAWSGTDELGQLGQHLDTVGAQVRGLIEELETKNQDLRRLAMFDHLTGLPNRTLLRELFGQSAASARRARSSMALLFIDLDEFKGINDTHGHSAGDELLVGVSQRLRATLRESDVVCRMGGDEFMVLLPRVEGWDAVAHMAERLVSAVQAPMALTGISEPARVGASIGISMFPADSESFDALARAADVAMYRSKELGRGRYSFYHADMDVTLRARLALERELSDAIELDQLRLHYQPVLDARSGRIAGCEALVRWQHPQHGLLMPDAFIDTAERTGLIEALGQWVLDTACEQLARWHAQGHSALQMAVNVSALQLQNPAFAQRVLATLARQSLGRDVLVLELTESTLLSEGDALQRAVTQLRAGGVQLAVDDFGTGFSSLAALKLVRPDRLKIDRSFVKDLPGQGSDSALVEAIFGMARALNVSVVAEGVETTEQRDWLINRGGHMQQGWLWSRALGSEAFEALLEAQPLPSAGGAGQQAL